MLPDRDDRQHYLRRVAREHGAGRLVYGPAVLHRSSDRISTKRWARWSGAMSSRGFRVGVVDDPVFECEGAEDRSLCQVPSRATSHVSVDYLHQAAWWFRVALGLLGVDVSV